MNYLIRAAAEKDILAVYHFICVLEAVSFDYAMFEAIYNENIHNKDGLYLVAESDAGVTIGFISCHIQILLHHCGRVAEIQELFVDENFRNMGIGNRLVKEMESKLLAKGCILFEVTAQNKRIDTHRFYERSGFASTHKKMVKHLV
jgi:(aminoalkyl)phosphonate N-acetyltransferase